MINHDLVEELSGLLDLDTQESGRFLNGFFTAMVTELLAVRKLAVKGLGLFSVVHVPLKKISDASGITYSPPCNRLTFDPKISRADDTARIAALRLKLNTAEAERLGRALATGLICKYGRFAGGNASRRPPRPRGTPHASAGRSSASIHFKYSGPPSQIGSARISGVA